MNDLIEDKDFYWEGPYLVFTSEYHLRKGVCCGSGCRHCPYEPRWTRGGTTPATEFSSDELNGHTSNGGNGDNCLAITEDSETESFQLIEALVGANCSNELCNEAL